MVAIHAVHYNFARTHKTLRITPAMAAGLSGCVWSTEELVPLVPERKPTKRGPYKKKGPSVKYLGMGITIKRKCPHPDGEWIPARTNKGYQLADPSFGNKKHHAQFAVYRSTLQEVAALVTGQHFHVRMQDEHGHRNLICPDSLEIIED